MDVVEVVVTGEYGRVANLRPHRGIGFQRFFLRLQVPVQNIHNNGHTGKVRHVLRNGCLSVLIDAEPYFKFIVVVNESLLDFLIGCGVLFSPPVTEDAVFIVLRTFRVKRMANLVAEDGAKGTQVSGSAGFGIKERVAQNAGGYVNCVQDRDISRIHVVRVHQEHFPNVSRILT